jgi:hypothetical protein
MGAGCENQGRVVNQVGKAADAWFRQAGAPLEAPPDRP